MVCLVLLGRRLTIQSEQSLTASLGVDQVVRLKRLLVRTVIVSLAFELAGASVLAVRFWGAPGVGSAGRAVYAGLFHAVSAFCNAGLSLFPDSFIRFRSDPIVLGATAVLIVFGGLGFLVINELPGYFNRRRKGRLPLHVRITVLTTLVLLAAGWALTALLEWKTTLAALAWPDRLSCALFHSVSSRTAGFSVVEMAESGHASRFVTMILMFIGGSPGSAAGGIKTTTAAVLFFTMLSMVRGRRETVFRDRTLTYRVVKEALSVFLLSLGAVGILYGLLLVSEAAALSAARFSASALLFDTVSAFGTVGLSAGVPPALTDPGKLIMIATMYIGRVGPLTMALIVGLKDTRQRVQYPEEDIIIG